jgi:hypothetical protein
MKNVLFILFLLIVSSCSKSSEGCYDKQLEREYKDKVCTMDCPGVTGCDGKEYCNECIANQQGIRVDH